MSFHWFLPFIVSEKSAILRSVSFSLAEFTFFFLPLVLSTWLWVPRYGFICFYSAWSSLSCLNLGVDVFYQFWKTLSYYFFKYCFWSHYFLFFSLWNSNYMYYFYGISHGFMCLSWSNFSLHFILYYFLLNWLPTYFTYLLFCSLCR